MLHSIWQDDGTVEAALTHSDERVETVTNCSACGKETTVPFKPTQGRPVYCRECFLTRKATGAAAG